MLHKPIVFSATILGVLLLLLIMFPLPPLFSQRLAESPWPTYRGNLKRTGIAPFKGPTTDKLRWVFSTGLSEKEGGIETDPVIGPDGTIYFGANNGIFYALDPESGAIRWAFPTDFDTFAIYSTAFVDQQGIVYFGAKDGKVYALQPPGEAGQPVKVRWTFASGGRDDKGGFENAPAIDNEGTLYIAANDGVLYALDTKSGKVKWSFDGVARAGYRTYAIFSSVAIGPDRTIYFGGKNGDLYAVRERTALFGTNAETVWSYRLGPGIQSSPLLTNDGTVYIGDERGTFHAVRPPQAGEQGAALWKFSTK